MYMGSGKDDLSDTRETHHDRLAQLPCQIVLSFLRKVDFTNLANVFGDIVEIPWSVNRMFATLWILLGEMVKSTFLMNYLFPTETLIFP